MKGSPPLCSLAMTEILSPRSWQDTLFPYHAAWDECNKQVHHQPKKTHIETNREKKKTKKKQKAKRGRAVTCGNITSDLTTTHLSKVFALHAELIAVWFSTDMHLHANAVVTNLSICPFSHGKENSASTTATQKVTAMPLVKRLSAKPRQLLPTTRAPVDFLHPCFTASRCKKITLAALRLPRDDSNAKFILGYTEHHKTDRCKLQVYLICPWRPLFTSLFLKEEHPFTHG